MAKSTQTKRKKNNTIWWILGVVGLVAALLVLTKIFKGKEGILVEAEQSKIRTIYSSTSESGTIQPTVDVPVAADVSGEVVDLYVKEGMQVKKGDLLVTIRPDNYKAALEQAQAGLNQAKAAELQARAAVAQALANTLQDSISLTRTKALYSEGVVSKVDWENANLKYSVSKSQYNAALFSARAAFYQVKTSEATVKQSRQNLDRTNIYASMDGTITQLNVELGQRVVGTMQMAGTEILKIADLSSMEVVVEISENDIVNLSLGDSAKIEVDAFPDRLYYGRVSEIAYSAKTDMMGSTDQVTNFEVKVIISPNSYASDVSQGGDIPTLKTSPFRPGMTALVEIFTDSKSEIVTVPIQAVTLSKKEKPEDDKKKSKAKEGDTEGDDDAKKKKKIKDDKPQEVVYKIVDGIAREIPVVTGISDDSYIYIREGLKEGEQVVIGPYSTLTKTLKDSMEVKIDTGEGKDKKKWGN
jgi:HlyD family secretion protein